jgi:predicted GNAT family N-acyltransferase
MDALLTLQDGDPRMDAVYALRHAVFVLEQHVPIEMERDDLDATATHLALLDARGACVATLRLLDAGPVAKIGRVAVRADHRRRGLATALLRRALELARARGHQEALLYAQIDATALYETLGFVSEGEIFVDAGIDHVTMRLSLKG